MVAHGCLMIGDFSLRSHHEDSHLGAWRPSLRGANWNARSGHNMIQPISNDYSELWLTAWCRIWCESVGMIYIYMIYHFIYHYIIYIIYIYIYNYIYIYHVISINDKHLVMFFTTSQDLRPFVHLTGSPQRCGDQKFKATDNFKGETFYGKPCEMSL